jgi:hypothetical protein
MSALPQWPPFGFQAPPNIPDYTTFLRNVVGIPASVLPDDSVNIVYSFDSALQWTNEYLGAIPGVIGFWSVYAQAVYNLGAALLIEYCPDPSWPISGASWSQSLATVTTSAPNTIQVGDRIVLSGISPILYIQPGRTAMPPNPAAPIYVTSAIDQQNFQYAVSPNPGAAIVSPTAAVQSYFFSNLRNAFRIGQFTPGLVTATSDQGTSVSLVQPHWAAGLGIFALHLTQTPWGRAYLGIASAWGPSIFGLTV